MNWKERFTYLVQHRRWKDIAVFARETCDELPANSEVVIEAIFLLLNRLLYGEPQAQAKHDEVAEALSDLFVRSYSKFHDNPEYLFFIGYFIALGEYYFGQDNLKLSHEMLRNAAEIEPEDILYAWGYRFSIGDPIASSLTEILIADTEKMKWLAAKGEAGKFMAEAIQTAHERYREGKIESR